MQIELLPEQVPSYIRRDRVQYAKRFVSLPSRIVKYWPFVTRRVTFDLNSNRLLADEDVTTLTNNQLYRALPVVGSTDIRVEFYTTGKAEPLILTNAADQKKIKAATDAKSTDCRSVCASARLSASAMRTDGLLTGIGLSSSSSSTCEAIGNSNPDPGITKAIVLFGKSSSTSSNNLSSSLQIFQ